MTITNAEYLMSKEKMKKQGVKSPNMRLMLWIMAVSLIDEHVKKQDNAYEPIRQRKQQDDNLFSIAGVR